MSDRVNFGRLKDVLPIPDLIEIQTKSFEDFLQRNVPPEKRENKGFQEVFKDIFTSDWNENGYGLEFLNYEVEEPKHPLVDCLKDGLTYEANIKGTFRLHLPHQKNFIEEKISLGDMPLMTEKGSFVINGVERVIVSQLHRSPGVCFEKMKHASGKVLYSYKIIADHGSWLEVQYDNKDFISIYLDRKHRRRKFLISTFLRAFGLKNDREVLDAVYRYYYFKKTSQRMMIDGNEQGRIQPMFGEPVGEPSFQEQEMISKDEGNVPRWLGVKEVPLSDLLEMGNDELLQVYTAEAVKDPSNEEIVLIESLSSLSENILLQAQEAGIEAIAVVDTHGTGDTFIQCIQAEHREFHEEEITPEMARKEIYTKMRPSDMPNDANAKLLFSRMFEDSRRYDLGHVGRYRIFKRLFHSPQRDLEQLISDDEKAFRERTGRIRFEELVFVFENFQRILEEFKGEKRMDEDEILRMMFSTRNVAFERLFNPGAFESKKTSFTHQEFQSFVKEGYRNLLEAEVVGTYSSRNVLGSFLEVNMESAVASIRKACIQVGLGPEKEEKRKKVEDDKLSKDIRKVLANIAGKKAEWFADNLRKNINVDALKSDESIIQALVCELLKEVACEIIAQVQDFIKSRRYLTKADIASSTAYLLRLKNDACMLDDIDHLGRRRLRTIGELLQNQCRAGLSRVVTNFREKLNGPDAAGKPTASGNIQDMSIAKLLNCRPLANAVRDFFGRNQLSQFMDQTNVLAELTNKRRLSALGPGGLTRERAGFDVRDVHSSHYGRVCPIETPEGPNIGLISSLALYAKIDEFGFINTPYRRVDEDGKVTDIVDYLTADSEENYVIAQANAPQTEDGKLAEPFVLSRFEGESNKYPREKVKYIDVSPKQLISAATGSIPFLEHDDANRALMGSNMQRQAVPLLKAERPLVGTGLEEAIARYSRAVMSAREDGIVASANAERIIVTKDGKEPEETAYPESVQVYNLYKFLRSNASTIVNQHPIVKRGDKVVKDQAIADGTSTDQGELALGRNVTVAFMSWHGYNFEDAIIISERLVMNDVYTSVHIDLEDVVARDTKLGPEEITRDIPNVGEEALRNLDSEGVVRVGAEVKPGDVLVGKITPKNQAEQAPEERLLKAIFGEKAADVKNSSLLVPGGLSGIVMDVRRERKFDGTKATGKRDDIKSRIHEVELKYKQKHDSIIDEMVRVMCEKFLGEKLAESVRNEMAQGEDEELIPATRKVTKSMLNKLAQHYETYKMRACPQKDIIDAIVKDFRAKLRDNEQCRKEELALVEQNNGSEYEKVRAVKVYIASKRKISVGDKMAGRHGNKGIVAKIVPVEDMPFMADGTPVDIILNPLGVPSRMNIGQVFETHVGWAAKVLGMTVATPVFDGIHEETVTELLAKAREVKVKEQGWTINEEGHVIDNEGRNRDECFIGTDGKIRLFDGRTGEPFAQKIMVGQIYMLKLDHLVANKIHARAVGSYSLVTQQPLGGKAQHGGQRFGEMEVWALEAYGAAYTLQEMLTVKSDDMNGRTRIYDSITKGNCTLQAGTPESFNVLMREMRSLCLNINVEHNKVSNS